MATVEITTLERCDQNGIAIDNGSYARIIFDWTADASTTATLTWTGADDTFNSLSISLSGTSGTKAKIFGDGELNIELAYDISVTVSGVTVSETLSYYRFPVDVLSGEVGPGVAIGKPATKKDTFEVDLNNEFLKTTKQVGNRYSHSSNGTSGQSGYIHLARISIISASANWPITFVLNQRKALSTMTLHMTLDTSNDTTSSLASFVYEGSNYGAFLVQSKPLVWDLYVQKSNTYDTITIEDWYTSTNMDKRMTVTFHDDMVTTVPNPYHRAIPAQLRSILDFVYPVGSVYISWSHVNPGTMFGGTWVRIENAFLWGCDENGGIGTTGGEKAHTLTTNEIPSHSHGAVYSGNATGTKNLPWLSTGVLGTGDKLAYAAIATGGGAAHNNMPPYVQVSIWRRTA